MNRKLFIKSIKAIEKQSKHDVKCARRLAKVYDASSGDLMYNNNRVKESLIDLLSDAMGGRETIKWFIWETDFGKREMAMNDGGEDFMLPNAGSLYDYLVKDKKTEMKDAEHRRFLEEFRGWYHCKHHGFITLKEIDDYLSQK